LQVYRRNTGERLAAPVALGVITATRPPVGADPRKFDFARVPGTDLSPLEFVGYNLDVASALPGDTVPLVLYFKLNAVAPERISGRVSLAHPFFTFWDFDSTPFEFSTRGKEIGDYIRVRVNTRISPELGPGNYQVTLALDGHPFVRTDLDTLHVESLTRVHTLPPAARATAARFGDSIELAGYQMTQASDRLNLTLYWRARTSVEKSYTVFTHVLETQNHVLAQSDSIPVAGERPTTSWTRGEVIEDTYELELPANLAVGDYPVEIGLYDAVNGARLPVFVEGQSNGDRFLLDPLKIR
jgi:hypothetical protein